MKDFIIDVVAAGTARAACVVAKSSGTLSERPLITRFLQQHSPPAEVAFTGMIAALKDISGFLSDDDRVEVRLYATQAPPMAGSPGGAAAMPGLTPKCAVSLPPITPRGSRSPWWLPRPRARICSRRHPWRLLWACSLALLAPPITLFRGGVPVFYISRQPPLPGRCGWGEAVLDLRS